MHVGPNDHGADAAWMQRAIELARRGWGQTSPNPMVGAVVVRDGVVVGIFSERDVIRGLGQHGARALDQVMRDVMTSPPITVTADASALGALSLMSRRRIRHLPVVEGDQLIGFVSIGDLVKHRIESIEREAAAMRDYIAGT